MLRHFSELVSLRGAVTSVITRFSELVGFGLGLVVSSEAVPVAAGSLRVQI